MYSWDRDGRNPTTCSDAFPRAIARLPNNQFVVLGDGAIEPLLGRPGGNRLTQLQGAEPTQDPGNWERETRPGPALGPSPAFRCVSTLPRPLAIGSWCSPLQQALVWQIWPAPTTASSATPGAVTFDNNGLLYLANGSANNVLRFDPTDNRFVDEFVSAGSGGLDFARAVRFGPDGHLYVASRNSHEILRYDGVSGDFLGVAVTPPAAPAWLIPNNWYFSGMINQTDPGFSGLFFDPARSGGRLDGRDAGCEQRNPELVSHYPPQSSTDQQAWLVSVGSVDGSRLVFDGVLRANGSWFRGRLRSRHHWSSNPGVR